MLLPVRRPAPLLIAQLLATLVLALLVLGPPRPAAADALLPDAGWPLDRVRVIETFDPPATTWGRGHRGVDLAAQVGDPVRAAAAGTVTLASRVGGRGVVVIDHGRTRTTYEPVTALVVAGSSVRRGAIIGRVGSGGHCNGRCLHWGLIAGRDHYLDPMLAAAAPTSGVRLLGADLRAVAERRARERAAAARAAAARASRDLAAAGSFTNSAGRGGFRHPVSGPISSGFGMRFHPVLHVWKLHDGTDFGAACGTPIVAAAPGVVASRGFSRGYGNRLMIDHGRVGGRAVRTGYNHAARYVVHRGDRIQAGQLIGYVGSTGYATGCHLHLMVWLDGRVTNPMTWFSP